MKLIELNPFIRFISEIHYDSPGKYMYARDCRIFYLLSGKFEIFIDDKNYILDKDSIFYCNSGSKYKILGKAHIISINFDLSMNYSDNTNVFPPTEHKIENYDIFSDFIDNSHFLNSHIAIKNGIKYKNILKSILHETALKTNFYQEITSGNMKQILTDMHRYISEKNPASSEPVNKVSEYIKNNFSKNITNKELASIAGYHEYYLNRLFISATGISMHQHLLNTRMYEAQQLMLNTNIPLNNISEMVGFNNYTHFSNYFKLQFGTSPSKYRSILKKGI